MLNWRKASPWISAAILLLCVGWTYAPALKSFFYLDDFFLVTISRLLENPLAPFANNHFPGGFFYRPFGIFAWWLSIKALGNAPGPQYLANFALHFAIALALWHLLLAWTGNRIGAVLAALAFALHPIGIGTSLWLSDRFDLLAVFFGILALDLVRAHARSERNTNLFLAASLICAMAAVLSKEIGLAIFPPLMLVLLWPLPGRSLRRRAGEAALVGVLALALLLLRASVLGSAFDSHFAGDASAAQILLQGFAKWASHFSGFALDFSRLSSLAAAPVTFGLILLALPVASGLLGAVRAEWRDERCLLALSAVALVLATCALQSPSLRLISPSPWPPMHAQMAVEARLFYYSLAGVSMLVLALCRFASVPTRLPHALCFAPVVAVALCLIPWAHDAHFLAKQYRDNSFVQMRLLQNVKATVDKLQLPARNCSVYLSGVDDQLEFVFAMQFDAAMKALAADIHRVEHCRFSAQRAPWFYVLREDALTPATAAPMEPLYLDGRQVPWPHFGGVEIAYLNLFDSIDAKSIPGAIFLAFDRGNIVDVTAEVRAGTRPFGLRCTRRPEQCVKHADDSKQN